MEHRLGNGAQSTQVYMEPGGQEIIRKPQYEVRPFKPEEAQLIYDELEKPNWAPWLAASPETLARRAEVFPEGQIALWGADGRPVASLSLNRFTWNGDVNSLPTWDQLAGDPPTYEDTFDPSGNSVGMMSINVRKDIQGGGLTQEIIDSTREMCKRLGIDNVMGSFRPSQFAQFAKDNPALSMEEYSQMRDERGLPVDKWLRALHRNGMRMLRIDDGAMAVDHVSHDEFEEYKRTYKPEEWKKEGPLWRCGETGFWVVTNRGKNNYAMYVESNVWGILDQNGNGSSGK